MYLSIFHACSPCISRVTACYDYRGGKKTQNNRKFAPQHQADSAVINNEDRWKGQIVFARPPRRRRWVTAHRRRRDGAGGRLHWPAGLPLPPVSSVVQPERGRAAKEVPPGHEEAEIPSEHAQRAPLAALLRGRYSAAPGASQILGGFLRKWSQPASRGFLRCFYTTEFLYGCFVLLCSYRHLQYDPLIGCFLVIQKSLRSTVS